MAESDEDAAVKDMLKEWPQLTGLEESLLKRMSKIRPAFNKISQQTPRAELFGLISEINDVARHVGDDQPVAPKQAYICSLTGQFI
jgi:hypothetical protein